MKESAFQGGQILSEHGLRQMKPVIIQYFSARFCLCPPMLVYRGFSQAAPFPTVLSIGNFDGVHRGHRALLARIRQAALENRLSPAVLTFEPHPRDFFSPGSAPTRLSSLREKLEMLAEEGIETTFICRFDSAVASLTAEQFISDILIGRLKIRHLIVGDDFRFGAGRKGTLSVLQEAGKRLGFITETCSSIVHNKTRISSSAVRTALAEGHLEEAALLLGRPYTIDGRVVHGKKLGRNLGFATANIRIRHDNPPLTGVFVVEVYGLPEGPHRGVANLGFRPSSSHDARALLEVHLFDFSANIYGAHLKVRFLHKLRNEMHFPDVKALKTQIARDVAAAHTYFMH